MKTGYTFLRKECIKRERKGIGRTENLCSLKKLNPKKVAGVTQLAEMFFLRKCGQAISGKDAETPC
jgi:hypothetical protein